MIRRYTGALLSQGVVSAFHFVLNLALVRMLVQGEYGVFALAFSIAFIVASMGNALFTVPISVLRPGTAEHDRADLELDLNRPAVAFGLAVTSVGLLASLLIGAGAGAQLATASTFIGSYLLRAHGRGVGYARFDTAAVLRADVAYVFLSAVALGVWEIVGDGLRSAWVVLLVLSVANVVSTAFLLPPRSWAQSGTDSALSRYRPYWGHAKWSLVGAVSTMVVAQGHGVIISLVDDAATFAPIAAGFILFGPVRILFSTVQNVLRPEMARSLASDNQRAAFRQASLSSGGAIAAVIALSLLVWALWGQISERLYAEQYGAAPMGQIVAFWVVASVAAAAGTGPNALLQALLRFRELALVGLVPGVLNVVLVTVTLLAAPARFTVLAVGFAEFVMAVATMVLAWRLTRTPSIRDAEL